MCGIAGAVVEFSQTEALRTEVLESALERLRHRGPDSSGQWREGTVWLGHTRLSILDLSEAGKQPMLSADGRYVITYNGEVYNFDDIAHEAELGERRSRSDTEVVLEAFSRLADGLFRRLNGIFAFAIHDRHENGIWLVRDRLGVKPLYYYQDENRFLFASEIHALLALIGSTPPCDLGNLQEWFFYSNILGGRTLFRGIRQLLPGHALHIDVKSRRTTESCYWSLDEEVHHGWPVRDSIADIIEHTQELLEAAVRRQLVSDVPLGIFLSGGIDSSAITAFASRNSAFKISTYAAGFDDPYGVDERGKAARVAEYFATDHHELFIEGRDLAPVVEALIDHHGGPFGDAANIPLYLMADQLGGGLKVILQGDGGDELFGGYRRYASLRHRSLLHILAPGGRVAMKLLPNSGLKQRILRYIDIYGQNETAVTMALLLSDEGSSEVFLDLFAPEFRRCIAEDDPMRRYREIHDRFQDLDVVQRMSIIDLSIILPDIYLEKVDRSTMAHGLEVRVPFLDHDLIDYVVRIPARRKMPGGKKKWLLKKALRGVVPDFVLDGPKTGFGVPFGFWLMGALREHFEENRREFQQRTPGIIRNDTVVTWLDQAEKGDRKSVPRLWKLYNLFVWANRFRVEFDV